MRKIAIISGDELGVFMTKVKVSQAVDYICQYIAKDDVEKAIDFVVYSPIGSSGSFKQEPDSGNTIFVIAQ